MISPVGRRVLLACSALMLCAGSAAAQVKIAVVNLQTAVLETAEIKKASTDMEARYKPRQEELIKLQNELQSIQAELQKGQGKLTPQAEADLQSRGQRRQRDAQRIQEDLQGDVDRERQEILGKASQRMQDVIKKLSDERAYDMVVDVSPGTNVVHFKAAMDITKDVIAAYDKAYPAK